MKKNLFILSAIILAHFSLYAQMPKMNIEGKEVYKGDDVVFHQIDDHTWVGTGHVMSNESFIWLKAIKKPF